MMMLFSITNILKCVCCFYLLCNYRLACQQCPLFVAVSPSLCHSVTIFPENFQH